MIILKILILLIITLGVLSVGFITGYIWCDEKKRKEKEEETKCK